jgi:16S rRNA (uracil1498-N3)-methyltransferase
VGGPRFFVPVLEPGARIELSGPDSRHALRSLRLRPGEEVSLSDNAGTVGTGWLRGERDGLAAVEVGEVRRVERPDHPVSVALAPPKGDRLAWAVQKLAELGVDEVLLVPMDRSVRTWDPGREARAVGRLRVVAREASMQARRPFLMELRVGGGLAEALGAGQGSVVVLWEAARERLTRLLPEGGPIRLVVGPEGGLSPREVDRARQAGAALASLGPSVLRSETAAVVGAALALARYGRLG